jgi:hypothetical protein
VRHGYASEPEARLILMVDAHIQEYMPQLREAHMVMVTVVTLHVCAWTSYGPHHSTRVVHYLQQEG